MKHVCVDARLLNSAGIGTFLRTIIFRLVKDKSYRLSFLIYQKDAQDDLFKNTGSNLIIVDSAIYSLKEQWELFVKIPKCDLFWSPHYNIPIFPIRARKRLTTIHDCYHLAFKKKLSLIQRIYAQLFYNGALLFSDKVTTDSHFSKKEINQLCLLKKEMQVVYVGIDHRLFRKVKEAQELSKIKKKYQLPDRFILAVGNVKPHKNLQSLLEAFRILKKDHLFEKLQLVIVGKKEGFITSDIKLFKDLPSHGFKEHIHFTGNVDYKDLPAIYSLSELYVFPSLYEGFGLPPIEAMACECPVIASNKASIPEVCQQGAFYVDPMNTQSMADAMHLLLTNHEERKKLIAKGKEVSLKYPAFNLYQRYKELIDTL